MSNFQDFSKNSEKIPANPFVSKNDSIWQLIAARNRPNLAGGESGFPEATWGVAGNRTFYFAIIVRNDTPSEMSIFQDPPEFSRGSWPTHLSPKIAQFGTKSHLEIAQIAAGVWLSRGDLTCRGKWAILVRD